MEHDALVIEVGLNEAAMRARAPQVVSAPAECASDAASCDDVRARLGIR